MQFKRGRLVAERGFVNAGTAAVLLALAACGSDAPGDAPAAPPARTGEQPARTIELPVVWGTSALDGAVRDVAISGGLSGLVAIAYEGRGLELFNLDAERVATAAPFALTALGNGVAAEIDGAQLTLFPGIDADGNLKAYVYGDGLVTPAEIDLPVEQSGRATGLCAAPLAFGEPGLIRMGYWTGPSSRQLVTGTLGAAGGELTWQPGEPVTSENPIAACSLTADGAITAGVAVTETARLARETIGYTLSMAPSGALFLRADDAESLSLTLRDGLSVKAPDIPRAIAAYGRPLSGNYPGGLVIVAGEIEPGDWRAVFVDTSDLTSPS